MSAEIGAADVFVSGISRADSACFKARQASSIPATSFAPAVLQQLLPELSPSEAAESASRNALAKSGFELGQVQFVISATQTPDFNNPGLVSRLLHRLGLNVGGLEIRQGACGAVAALEISARFVQTGQADVILVVAADMLSRYFGAEEQGAVLSDSAAIARSVMADGAAAFVVSRQAINSKQGVLRYIDSGISGYGQGFRDFHCHLPSASRFPQRITREDVQQGLHFPVLNPLALLQSLDQRVFADYRNKRLAFGCTPTQLVSHSIVNGIAERIAQLCDLKDACLDCFPDVGFIGSAGIPWAMSQISGATTLWAVASSGPQWGWAVLEPWGA
ncbi:MAG: hypothetical protein K1X79_06685 [Oligoflexia bacterium]|nr:hypothetical protein [Oligoflexia bacterium]